MFGKYEFFFPFDLIEFYVNILRQMENEWEM